MYAARTSPSSCCCENQRRLENARQTLKVLQGIYEKTEREITELQREEQTLQALCDQRKIHLSCDSATQRTIGAKQNENNREGTVPPGFTPLRHQQQPGRRDDTSQGAATRAQSPQSSQTSCAASLTPRIYPAPREGSQAVAANGEDSDEASTRWMDLREDIDYDSSDDDEQSRKGSTRTEAQKKREIYKSFNPSRLPKTDAEIDRLVCFPPAETTRKIRLDSSESEDEKSDA